MHSPHYSAAVQLKLASSPGHNQHERPGDKAKLKWAEWLTLVLYSGCLELVPCTARGETHMTVGNAEAIEAGSAVHFHPPLLCTAGNQGGLHEPMHMSSPSPHNLSTYYKTWNSVHMYIKHNPH